MITKNKNCQECDDCGSNAAQVMPPQNKNNCPQPNPCTSVTSSSCVFHLDANVLCGTNIIINKGDTQTEINAKIIDYMCDNFSDLSGSKVVFLTYIQSQNLVSSGGVQIGTKYFITDRSILLTGIAVNLFSVEGQRTMRVVKHKYYDSFSPSLGVWYNTIIPTINSVVIWGGKCWKNLTGSAGSSDNNRTLNAFDWELIPTTNSTYYETRIFTVYYDFNNDWIAKQFDWKGNEFGVSWATADDEGLSFNPVDISDWGCELVADNKARGVYNNTYVVINNVIQYAIYLNSVVIGNTNDGAIFDNTAAILENSNKGTIQGNNMGSTIQLNTNLGDISGNTCGGSILSNSNGGTISGNSNDGNIEYNTNRTGIISNANDGDISFNSNNGGITSNSSNVNSIQYNNNNGDIRDNTCTSSIRRNSNSGNISKNSNMGQIAYNSNLGGIEGNTNTGNIQRNSNNEYMFENSNIGNIEDNSNNGYISFNTNNGYISFNTNNGHIGTIGATTTNITKNNNNGDIFNTVVGVISDVIVDK